MKRSIVEPGSSSAVRDAILSQHDRLRVLLVNIGSQAAGATAADELELLRSETRRLYEVLDEHMAFEERTLPTALRDVIGWGAALQAQMEEEHARQRAMLAAAAALEPVGRELADGVRAFVDTLLADMEKEEQELLQADVDAMTVDGEGG